MKKIYCGQCKCWDNSIDHHAPTEEEGYCHYWPPNKIGTSLEFGKFVKTHEEDFCFQGEPKEEQLNG